MAIYPHPKRRLCSTPTPPTATGGSRTRQPVTQIIAVCIQDESSAIEENSGLTIHDPNPSLSNVIGQVRGALSDSWEKHSNVRFVGFEYCEDLSLTERNGTVGVYIDKEAENSSRLGRGALGLFVSDLQENTSFKPWGNFTQCIEYDFGRAVSEYRFSCVEEYARHEIGHVLGFKHEWVRKLNGVATGTDLPTNCDFDDLEVYSGGSSVLYTSDQFQTAYDHDSLMTYTQTEGDDCADRSAGSGERFGSPNLSAVDQAAAAHYFPPVPANPYAVGVIPDVAGSCPNPTEVGVYIDNENDNNFNARDGWNGAINSDHDAVFPPDIFPHLKPSNTYFQICQVDGLKFKNLAGSLALQPAESRDADYAVLKLGTQCPPGSTEFVRLHDDQDNPPLNQSYMYGDTGPTSQRAGWGPTDTVLHFCLFQPENGGPYMNEFPDVINGAQYGVFAGHSDLTGANDFIAAFETGYIRLDDEDNSNDNSVLDGNGNALTGTALTGASRIVPSNLTLGGIGGGDTHYMLALVNHSMPISPNIDDAFEENDYSNEVTTPIDDPNFAVGLGDATILSNDDDWWFWKATEPGTLRVFIDFAHVEGDLDLQVFNINLSSLGSSASIQDNEIVEVPVNTNDHIYARVYGFQGADNEYTLNLFLDDSFAPNHVQGQAAAVNGYQVISGLRVGLGFDDWFSWQANGFAGDVARVETLFTHANGDIDLEIMRADGTPVDTAQSSTNGERVVARLDSNDEIFLVRVDGFNGAANDYTIELAVDDPFELNDDETTAISLAGDIAGGGLKIGTTYDEDHFSWQPNTIFSSSVTINLLFTHANGDLDIRVFDADNNPVGFGFSNNDNEQVVLQDVEQTDTFRLVILGSGGDINSYGFEIIQTPDSDRDGLTDEQEAGFGTNPLLADSDNDGASDLEEIGHDGDLENYDPETDTDPNNPDTDGDGIEDGIDPHPLMAAPPKQIPATSFFALLCLSLMLVGIAFRNVKKTR